MAILFFYIRLDEFVAGIKDILNRIIITAFMQFSTTQLQDFFVARFMNQFRNTFIIELPGAEDQMGNGSEK
jgi:hypothetical protein